MRELIINPEFRDLIPPLNEDELKALEEEIRSSGKACSPLTVWNGTILDGHHRYAICRKYGLPFKVLEKEFKDKDDAMIWMIDHQSARRNLSIASKIKLSMKKIEIFTKRAKKRQGKRTDLEGTSNISADLRGSYKKVSEDIARGANVGTRTVEQFIYRYCTV